jgi:hypothetical protein
MRTRRAKSSIPRPGSGVFPLKSRENNPIAYRPGGTFKKKGAGWPAPTTLLESAALNSVFEDQQRSSG